MGLREFAAIGGALGCAALTTAGCGGQGGDQSSRPVDAAGRALISKQAVATTPSAPPPASKTAVPKPHSYAVGSLAEIEQRALRHMRTFEAAGRHRQQMSAAAHARATRAAVRDLIEAVLVSSGLDFATYDVLDGGKTVIIDIARRDACALQAGDSFALSDRILNASDVVEHVRLRLTPAGALGPYLKSHCHKAKAVPSGIGATLLTVGHDGVFETKPFHAARSHWTIEWSSSSRLLQIYVYKDGKLRSLAVNHEGRGTGSTVVSGSGTYTLRVAGTARWRVRVRDGSANRVQVATPETAPDSAP